MWGFFITSIAGVIAAIAILERRYAAPTVPIYARVSTALAWLVAFAIVALVPPDVYAALAMRPPGAALDALWAAAFWSTQALTWLVLPFVQVYADAGDFTPLARALTSLRENGVVYGAIGAAGAVGVALLLLAERSLAPRDLPALAMALSNTFALSVGLLLVGYGLVEIPRRMWRARPERRLLCCEHRMGRLAAEAAAAADELALVRAVVAANARQMPRRDPLRPFMDRVAAEAQAAAAADGLGSSTECGGGGGGRGGSGSGSGSGNAAAAAAIDAQLEERMTAEDFGYADDLAGLSALRRRLRAAAHAHAAARQQYADVAADALVLRAMAAARAAGDFSAPPPGAPGRGEPWGAALWRYRCTVHPYVRQLGGLLLALLSLAVVWSEATIFTARRPDLSPFSLAIRAAVPRAWAVMLLTALPLSYICGAAYWSLFHLSAFEYNKLLPKATTGAALIQNGSLACRFAPAVAWNFLHVIHMDGRNSGAAETVFRKNMGRMDVVPLLGRHLDVALPLLLVAHCAAVKAGAWDRLLATSRYRLTSDDDADDEHTARGRALLQREAAAAAAGRAPGGALDAGGSAGLGALAGGGGGVSGGARSAELARQTEPQQRKRGWFSSFVRGSSGGDGSGSGAARPERAPLLQYSHADGGGSSLQLSPRGSNHGGGG